MRRDIVRIIPNTLTSETNNNSNNNLNEKILLRFERSTLKTFDIVLPSINALDQEFSAALLEGDYLHLLHRALLLLEEGDSEHMLVAMVALTECYNTKNGTAIAEENNYFTQQQYISENMDNDKVIALQNYLGLEEKRELKKLDSCQLVNQEMSSRQVAITYLTAKLGGEVYIEDYLDKKSKKNIKEVLFGEQERSLEELRSVFLVGSGDEILENLDEFKTLVKNNLASYSEFEPCIYNKACREAIGEDEYLAQLNNGARFR